ncbi:MAG: hypothetical protein ACRBN8_02050 [Nannocystales bacterium]
MITLGGRAVATTSADPIEVNTLQASSTAGIPAVDLLGSIVSTDPTGVVLVRHGDEGVVFALQQGRVVGAFGTGPRGSMQAWSQAARTQEIERAMARPGRSGVGLVRLFVERCVLEHLPMATEVGSTVSVLRGDVRWTGSRLDLEDAPSLQHLLMDFARESDDCQLIEVRLQPLSRIVVPLSPPLQTACTLQSGGAGSDGETSFGDLESEDASEGEGAHKVLWAVWRMCDGMSSIDAVAERSVFGRAPTLRALDELRRRRCVQLSDSGQGTVMALPDLKVLARRAAEAVPTEPDVPKGEPTVVHEDAVAKRGGAYGPRRLLVVLAVAVGLAAVGVAAWLLTGSRQAGPSATGNARSSEIPELGGARPSPRGSLPG